MPLSWEKRGDNARGGGTLKTGCSGKQACGPHQPRGDCVGREVERWGKKDFRDHGLGVSRRPGSGGVVSLGGLTPVESCRMSQCNGAGMSHPQHMAIPLASLRCDLHATPASHGRPGPVMRPRCALDGCVTYVISQRVYEVCQWGSPGCDCGTPWWDCTFT